jgi:hypothetical protein
MVYTQNACRVSSYREGWMATLDLEHVEEINPFIEP